MSVLSDLIRVESDDTISFGDYASVEKLKVNDFRHNGDVYDLRTHDKITRLQKNSSLLFESVPGTKVLHFAMNEKVVRFDIEGFEDTQVTLELEANKEYKIIVDDTNVGNTLSTMSGKVNFSIPLNNNTQSVRVEKI